ncbi:MAG: hypothetical protein QW622_03195 [Candidatus Pacearchaeota archaeon]
MRMTDFLKEFLLGFDFEGRVAKKIEELAKEYNFSLTAKVNEIYLGSNSVIPSYRYSYQRIIEVETASSKFILIPKTCHKANLKAISANISNYDAYIFFDTMGVSPNEVAFYLFKRIYEYT